MPGDSIEDKECMVTRSAIRELHRGETELSSDFGIKYSWASISGLSS